MSEDGQVSKNRLHGLWALTNRDLKKWYKAPIVFLLTILQPIVWMGLLGKSLNIGAIFSTSQIPPIAFNPPLTLSQLGQLSSSIHGLSASIMKNTFGVTDYFSFMAMGMVSFATLFTASFSGMSVVWDRRLGFLEQGSEHSCFKVSNNTIKGSFSSVAICFPSWNRCSCSNRLWP